VTTPEPTAVADVYALVKVLSRTPVTPPMGLVVNCTASVREGRSVSDRVSSVAAKFLGVAIDDFGQILRDENVPVSIRRRCPVVSLVPRCSTARGVAILADRILSGDDGAVPTPGFFRKLFGHFY
jgi:flagellar biosynthesis protein FlhG